MERRVNKVPICISGFAFRFQSVLFKLLSLVKSSHFSTNSGVGTLGSRSGPGRGQTFDSVIELPRGEVKRTGRSDNHNVAKFFGSCSFVKI